MWDLFGQSADYEEFAKKAIEEHILEILDEGKEASLAELFNRMIHSEHQYFIYKKRIEAILEQLDENASISLSQDKVELNHMTIIDHDGGLQTIAVIELHKKREKEERIKELFRIHGKSALEPFL